MACDVEEGQQPVGDAIWEVRFKFICKQLQLDNMVDILLICITVIMVIIIFGVSFYMLIVYCHPDEKGFGSSIPSKIVVVFGMGLSWGQLLLIPLDVSNAIDSGGINMLLLYSIVYIVIYIFCTVVVPFMIFLYESDEDDGLCKRIGWALFSTFLIQVFTSLLIFVSYNWLSVYHTSNGDQAKMYTTMYMMVCMSFAGWFLLSIFGGVGLLALPIDLINAFVNRPKTLKPEEARQKKKEIQMQSSRLVEVGQVLKEEEVLLSKSEEGWWARRKQTGQLNSKFEQYKKDVTALEQQAELFKSELAIQKQNPIFPVLFLFIGILCVIFTVIWFIQILFGVILRPGGNPVFGFVNDLLSSLNKKGLNFVSTGIYGILTIYLLWCVQKGNLSFGIRIPFIMSFHPMKKNQTYLNSFLFNINLMLLASMATTQLAVFAFSSYTYPDPQIDYAGSLIGQTFAQQVQQLPFFGFIYNRRIFPIVMLCITALQGIYSIVKAIVLKRKKDKQKD